MANTKQATPVSTAAEHGTVSTGKEVMQTLGLSAQLMNKRITLFCLNYFYTGDLAGIYDDCVLLSNPKIVYETGDFKSKDWKDAQALPNEIYVMKAAIESFGIVK